MIFFLSHPIQYISPLIKELSSRTELKVYYYGGQSTINKDIGFGSSIKWDLPLLEGYDYYFLKNISFSKGMNNNFFDAVNFDIIRSLKNLNNEIIILNGWSYFSDWIVLIFAKLFGHKVWLRSEMPWNQELLKGNSIKKKTKYFIFKKILFKYFVDKFLYIGLQNKIFYQMHGIENDRLIYTPYAVDNLRFQSTSIDKNAVREKWGIKKNQIVILFSGKLISKKRPLDLLLAYSKIQSTDLVLFFMGDGPLRNEIEYCISDKKVHNVIISGFLNQSEISSIYSISDIFVMCSGVGETWGLSVNEAMNFKLPVLISNTCGSSYDLVSNNYNGFIFNEGDILELTELLKKLIDNNSLRLEMGKNSFQIINNFSYDVTCKNLLKQN
jgi:glycosyltransferase involved in cell wall biosynthesis